MISVSGIGEASVQQHLPKLPTAIFVGDEVELRCHVDGSGDMKYEWFKLVTKLSLFTRAITARGRRRLGGGRG